MDYYEFIDYLKIFYEDIRREKDWDVYLLHIQAGVKDLKPFEEWRKPPEKVEKEDILNETKKVLDFMALKREHMKSQQGGEKD